jgi:hypothetical protein
VRGRRGSFYRRRGAAKGWAAPYGGAPTSSPLDVHSHQKKTHSQNSLKLHSKSQRFFIKTNLLMSVLMSLQLMNTSFIEYFI